MNKQHMYILVMAAVTFLIRAVPVSVIQKQIKNRFIRSFLFYVPYVTLAAMTVPAMITATRSPISGICAFLVGLIAAWKNGGLFKVAVFSCVTVILVEGIMHLFGVI